MTFPSIAALQSAAAEFAAPAAAAASAFSTSTLSIREVSCGYCGAEVSVSPEKIALRQAKLNFAVVTRVERLGSDYIWSSHSTVPGAMEPAKSSIST